MHDASSSNRRAGTQLNESGGLVEHDFQNAEVAADEQALTDQTDFLPARRSYFAGIPADVGHTDVDARALPKEILRQIGGEFRPAITSGHWKRTTIGL